MTQKGSSRLILVVVLLVIAIGLIAVLAYLPDNSNNTNTQTLNNERVDNDLDSGTLPNSLDDGNEGALTSLTINGQSFIVLSSIDPLLRSESPAQAEVLDVNQSWLPMNFYRSGNITPIGGTLLAMFNTEDSEDETIHWLEIFDSVTRTWQEPIELHRSTSESTVTESEGVTYYEENCYDIIPSFSADSENQKILVVKQVCVYADPGAIYANDNSRAEIWEFDLGSGEGQLLSSIEPEASSGDFAQTSELWLPSEAHRVGDSQLVLIWPGKVELLDTASDTRTLLLSGEHSSYQSALSPDGSRLVVLEQVFQSDILDSWTWFWEYAPAEAKFRQITNLTRPLNALAASWDNATGDLYHFDPFDDVLRKMPADGTTMVDYSTPENVEANEAYWIGNHLVLLILSISPDHVPDEVPETDFNYPAPMAVWNLETNEVTELDNYRNTIYSHIYSAIE